MSKAASLIPNNTEKPFVKPNAKKKPGFFQRIMTVLVGDEMSPLEKAFRDNLAGIKDVDLRAALSTAMATASPDMYCYIVAVFDDRVVYESLGEDYNWAMFQRSYSLNGNTVVLADDEMAVRPVTNFVPVSVESGKAGGMVANSKGGDPGVEAVSTEVAAEVAPAQAAVVEGEIPSTEETPAAAAIEEVPGTTEPVAPAAASTAEEIPAPALNKAVATTEQIDAAVATKFNATGDEIAEALAFKNQQKLAMIDRILSSDKCAFSKEELSVFTLGQLEKLTKTLGSPSVNYAAAAGSLVPEAESNVGLAPMQAFPRVERKVLPFAAGGKK
jgi:hypothetical protein